MADDKDKEKKEEIPEGYAMATLPTSRVWNGRLFGKGTYPVPAEAKDWLEGVENATEQPPAVSPTTPAQADRDAAQRAARPGDGGVEHLMGNQRTVVDNKGK